nr:hypothetical protein BaRGS_034738 [Batillaria attramentaria]
MLSVPDITRTPDITIKWKGWTDADSKMYRYSMEVFQMTRATNGELEIHPDRDLDPLINRPVLHDGNRLYAEQYTLPSPGMYSIILEVADRANNTKYVRRLCLYDPNPEITLDPDPDHDLFVSSANPDSGYAYQNKRKDPVVVTWDQHFKNVFQVENNPVRAYGPELENNVKQIPQDTELEDHEGDRTIDAIPNIDGIANFQVAYVKDHSGGSDQPEPPSSSQWTDLYLNTTYIVPVPDKELVAADTVTIWVKATDATGIEKVARTKVSFDFTPPELNQEDLASGFRMNTAVEGMDFSSTFNLQVFDWESGIDFIQWTFTRRNGDVVYKTKEPGKTVQVKSRTKDSVTITWDYPPSCFERTGFWVIVNGQRHAVHMDAREYVISGLEPGQSYTIYMVTDFIGGEQSDQQAIVCATEDDDGLGDFAIAGITIGLLILLALIVLIVVFVLYRRRVILQEPGPVNKQLSRMSHAFDNARRFTMKRSNPEGGFSNNAYMLGEDAVYPDGHMALNTHRNWQLADSDLTFQDHVAEGKSAKIYKATWRHDGLSDIVAAKMLKPGFSKEDAQKMMAKINFFATAFGNHDNVIRFLGAVTNNTSRGPVLVMEYCECGQMDEWLASRRNNVDEQTMQNMFRFSLGVAKGMEYLASKGITHGRLAARNVLLTFVLDAKVAGFGPQHKEGAEHNMVGSYPERVCYGPDGEAVATQPRFTHFTDGSSRQMGLHRKCWKDEPPTEKSDVWSVCHYDLMKECWHHNQSQRPTFKTVRARLENFSPDKRQSVDSYYETTSFSERQIGHL